MVIPGIAPLTLIRGIEFDAVILQCRDLSATVTGTLTPNATGTYVLSGAFSGLPLFILDAAPSYFLYWHPIAQTYIISATLSTGVIADYWLGTPGLTDPTATYAPQGAYTGTATATDNPVNLTGYSAEAKVRRTPLSEVYIDLNPSVTNASTGEVTIPLITSPVTRALPVIGNFQWDFVLKLISSGERFGPFVTGPFTISDNISQL